MRMALDDAAPLYRDAPEAQEARASGERTVHVFMQEQICGTICQVPGHLLATQRTVTRRLECATIQRMQR